MSKRVNLRRRSSTRLAWAATLAIGSAWLALTGQQLGARANFHFCFPQFTGVPFTWSPPNVTDGIVSSDLGWTNGFRFVFENGTMTPDVTLQGLKQDSGANKFLYLSFEIKQDPTIDNDDMIILAFDPDGTVQNQRRIHVFPFSSGAAVGANSLAPREVKYWNGGGSWSVAAVVNPSWLKNNIRGEYVGAGAWNVEMQIPINAVAANTGTPASDSGINLPASGEFGLYVNVARVDGGTGDVSQRIWPPTLTNLSPVNIADFDPETSTPAPSEWGGASRTGAVCGGVGLTPSAIQANNGYVIDMISNNNFSANVTNSSKNAAGTSVDAIGVKADFSISTYGLSTTFKHIPAPNNPTPAKDIGPDGAFTFQIGPFNPSVINANWTQADHDALAANAGDSCVFVSLDGAPGTLFIRKSTWENMSVINASSPFERRFNVTIGREVELPRGSPTHEVVIHQFNYNTPPQYKWQSEFTHAQLKRLGENAYTLTIDPRGDLAAVATARITPPAEVKIPIQRVRVPPGTHGEGRRAVRIPVKPNNLLTLTAAGSVRLRGAGRLADVAVGPTGVRLNEAELGGPVARSRLVLNRDQDPEGRVGALVGSFDGFKTAFVIGGAATIKVPPRATALQLAINDAAALAGQQRGAGYDVLVTATPAIAMYAKTNSLVARDPSREKFVLPFGVNLPLVTVTGERRTGRYMTINGHRYHLTESVGPGAFGLVIRSIGPLP